MVLLSIDFANLHTILETLYGEMMPLCEEMMDVGKGLAGLGALFYVAVRVWQSMARARAGRRVSAAPSLCHRHLHSALSHTGARHAEQCAQPHRAGHAQDAGGADAGHGTVPCPEGGAGTGGHAAQSRDRPPGERRGVRPAAGRAGLVTHGHRLAAGHVRGSGDVQSGEKNP